MKIMAFRDSISFAGPVCYESSSSLYEYFFSRAGRAAFCIQIVMYAVTPSPDCHVMTNTNDVSVARGRGADPRAPRTRPGRDLFDERTSATRRGESVTVQPGALPLSSFFAAVYVKCGCNAHEP